MEEDGLVRSYRDLWVWKEGMDLAEMCYGVTKSFPREEIFGMISQIRRAAIPANIAEGHGSWKPTCYWHPEWGWQRTRR